ncbi:MAG: trigger factor [Beggiatoa sp. IS2]|nr:MAG: trigger factor [Beggiatoa sp. IS2]
MHVSVETTSTSNDTLECRMTVGVPKERIEPQVRDRLKSLARTAKFNGFRPGKVPMKLVEQKYGSKVREEILGEVLRGSFDEAIQQEKLQPIGQPSFNISSDPKNLEQGLLYTATFEILSGISAINIEALEVNKPVVEILETDVDVMLERLRAQRQVWHQVNTPAKKGDRVIVDFLDASGDDTIENTKNFPLILGKNNTLLPGVEENLWGVCVGEEHEVPLTFPGNHVNVNLAGKTVRLKVRINSVETSQLPEIDAEFAKALGVEDGNLDTLRQDARNNMERELEYAVQHQVKQQILNALLNANPVQVSGTIVDEEAQRLLQKFVQDLESQGRSLKELKLTPDLFREQAKKRVKLGLLILELVKRNDIQLDQERVRQFIERLAATYEDSEAIISWYNADQSRIRGVESTVLEDQVVEWLLEKAKVTEVKTDFYTLMAQSRERF